MTGKDTIELGCGTAYVSAWLARRGARPVGIDNSEQQLATARRLQAEHGIEFPLIHGNAEAVPYPDASFDLAISEYGASIWADPYRWIPEAARLLRPGGRLIFLVNSTILMLCMPDEERPATDEMLRPLPRPPSARVVERRLGQLRASARRLDPAAPGERLRRSRTSSSSGRPRATDHFPYATNEWARQWPSEEVWVARKEG